MGNMVERSESDRVVHLFGRVVPIDALAVGVLAGEAGKALEARPLSYDDLMKSISQMFWSGLSVNYTHSAICRLIDVFATAALRAEGVVPLPIIELILEHQTHESFIDACQRRSLKGRFRTYTSSKGSGVFESFVISVDNPGITAKQYNHVRRVVEFCLQNSSIM